MGVLMKKGMPFSSILIRMKREAILIALCVAAFIAVAGLGVEFINKEQIADTGHTGHTRHTEGFKASTRASDCNCLPGYIPTKNNDTTYFCQNFTDPSKTRKCY